MTALENSMFSPMYTASILFVVFGQKEGQKRDGIYIFFFLHVIKENNRTTILNSKQTEANKRKRDSIGNTANAFLGVLHSPL